MSRSKWKGLNFDIRLYNSLFEVVGIDKEGIKKSNWNHKIWSRESSIPASLIGKSVYVYNGKVFKRFIVSREKVGYKFGDFSFSRKYTFRKLKQKKK